MIINFRMLTELLMNVIHFTLRYFLPACWTFLVLVDLVNNITSKFIFFDFSCHKPISIEAIQVKPVKAFFDSNQIRPLREQLLPMLAVSCKVF